MWLWLTKCEIHEKKCFITNSNTDMESVPISPLIDPHGILETLKKEEFLHGEENQVHYYQVHENTLQSGRRCEMHILLKPESDTDKKRKCGSGEPPNLSCRRHCWSPGFLHHSTSERQQTQNDCCTAVHRAAGCKFQPGKTSYRAPARTYTQNMFL